MCVYMCSIGLCVKLFKNSKFKQKFRDKEKLSTDETKQKKKKLKIFNENDKCERAIFLFVNL